MQTTRFGLLRHVETQWNCQKRIQGHGDSPLTLSGESEGQAWARLLQTRTWDRILVSDTGRAVKTAEIINAQLNIQMTTDSRLREQNWGSWTAKTWDQVKTEASQLMGNYEKEGWNFCPPGGESRSAVLNRGCEALAVAAKRWPQATILVITHEGIIRCLFYHFYGLQFLPGEPALIKPRHLHWIKHTSNGLQPEEINALSLPGSASESRTTKMGAPKLNGTENKDYVFTLKEWNCEKDTDDS